MDARAIARTQAREQARQRAQVLAQRLRDANPFPPELVQRIDDGHGEITSLTSIDPTHFVAGTGGDGKIWEKTPEGAWALKISKKTGPVIATTTHNGKLIFGCTNSVKIHKLDSKFSRIGDLWVQGALDSPDNDKFATGVSSLLSMGESLFVGSGNDIYQFDLAQQFPGRRGVAASLPLQRILRGTAPLSAVVSLCNADGDLVSGAIDGTIKVWRGEECIKTTGKRQYAGGRINSICYLGSRRVASGQSEGKIFIWNLDWDGEPTVLVYPLLEEDRRWERNPIRCLCHLGGNFLAAGAGGRIYIWNVETQVCVKTLVHTPATRTVNSLLYLGDGTLVAGMQGRIQIWNVGAILGMRAEAEAEARAEARPVNDVNFTWNLSHIPRPVLGNIRIVPRMTIDPDTEEEERTTDALTGEEIEDGMAMTDFQRDATRTEFDLGKYYTKTSVDQLMRTGGRHPETRQPIRGVVQYTASVPTPTGNLLGSLNLPVAANVAANAAPVIYPPFAEANLTALTAGLEINRLEQEVEARRREVLRQIELARERERANRERERANRERVNLAFQNMGNANNEPVRLGSFEQGANGSTRRRRRHRSRLSLSRRR